MTHSYTSEQTAKQHGLAMGYRYWFGRPYAATDIPHPRGDIAGAYLISCAKDMGNYLIAHMNGGVYADTRILSESGISQLHTPETGNLNYAMGWRVGTAFDTPTIGHGGLTPTSRVAMTIFPEYQRGFVLLVNAQNQLSGPSVSALGWNVGLNVIGQMAMPVARAPVVHRDLALLCALLLGQLIGFAFGCRRTYRWWKYPNTRPTERLRNRLIQVGLFLIVDIVVALGMLWWIPQSRDIPLSGLMLYAPDAGWLLLLNGSLALIDCIVSIGEVAFLIQQAGHIRPVTTEPMNAAAS
jgi:CubicO group peptidase (beta-lactamase class C family)